MCVVIGWERVERNEQIASFEKRWRVSVFCSLRTLFNDCTMASATHRARQRGRCCRHSWRVCRRHQNYCKSTEYLLAYLKYEKNPLTCATIREKGAESTVLKLASNTKGGQQRRLHR